MTVGGMKHHPLKQGHMKRDDAVLLSVHVDHANVQRVVVHILRIPNVHVTRHALHGNRRPQGVIRQQRRPGNLVLSTITIEGLFELFLLDHQVELAYRITPDGLHCLIQTGESPPGVWRTPGEIVVTSARTRK